MMSEHDQAIRLLMVDDEREFLQAVEPGLTRRGFDVTFAENGPAALELLASRTFDVAVLDVKMPGIDGVDLFRKMKGSVPELPVILLTGHGNIQDAFETTREGVFEYLTKPCEVDELARVVRQAAETRIPTQGAPAKVNEEIRLLLVDDDVEFVRAVLPTLERRGIRVREAFNGLDALFLLEKEIFHVALVDVVMEGMDGLTLLNRLKEEDPWLEVIVLTGNPQVGDVRRGLMDGAFDYLIKPQPVEALVDVIAAAWERRQSRKEKARKDEVDRVITERPD